ncbi:MAG: AMP-binding protein [Bacteroidetes bacterium]|nr:AMP-binding protein [Bacteroidota bacterium]
MEINNYLPEIEREPIREIIKFQENQLCKLLAYLKEHSPFYSALFRNEKINPDKIKSIEDLHHIPVTTKNHLQKSNEAFICVPKEKIIDYITTSGTMGDPVTFAMTDKDLERLAYNEAISFVCAEGSRSDIYQLMTTIDRRFMAGLAYFIGIRKLGAGIVRVGNGIPELQWETIHRIHPNAIIAVPSFILKIIEYAEQHDIDYKGSSIVKAVCIGEPLRNNDFSLNTLGRRINEKWPIRLFSTYASTEMATSFTECGEGHGGHHHPELIIVEFLNEHDLPVKEGEPGEVTITTLGVEGMPLLRFKTGDICHHFTEPCKCGRSTMRLGPVIGRKKQMIKYKGTTLYPPAFYDILDNIEYISNYVVEVYTNSIGTDEILIHVGSRSPIDEREKDIKDHFRARLRVAPLISFKTTEAIQKIQFPELSRKPVMFIDNREKK